MLSFIAESIESDDDSVEFQAFLEEEFAPSQSESPSANAFIEPAGQVRADSSDKKEESKKCAEAAIPALANTGFDGVSAAGVGLLLALTDAVVVALGRRKSAKH